jgi:hypothetical protein
MNNIIIIGDSHAEALNYGWEKASVLDFKKDTHKSIVYSGVSAYNINYSKISKKDIEGSIVILFFGECDIRRNLPKYNNASEVVEKYIDYSLEFFKGCKIFFIKPVPQAIDRLTHEFNKNKAYWYSLEKRLEQQEKFYKSLDNYANINVIDTPNIIGTNIVTSDYSEDGCHLNKNYCVKLALHIKNVVNQNI